MPVYQPMLAIAKHNFDDLEMIDADNISGMWAGQYQKYTNYILRTTNPYI
jgi:hypothetical protein